MLERRSDGLAVTQEERRCAAEHSEGE